MTGNSIWHGTDDEFRRLQAAVEQHCACATADQHGVSVTCGAHVILTDERVLNHLLYVCRTRERFEYAEWTGGQLLYAFAA